MQLCFIGLQKDGDRGQLGGCILSLSIIQEHTAGDATVTSLCTLLPSMTTSFPGQFHILDLLFQHRWTTCRACWLYQQINSAQQFLGLCPTCTRSDEQLASISVCYPSPLKLCILTHIQEGETRRIILWWEGVKEIQSAGGKKAAMRQWAHELLHLK